MHILSQSHARVSPTPYSHADWPRRVVDRGLGSAHQNVLSCSSRHGDRYSTPTSASMCIPMKNIAFSHHIGAGLRGAGAVSTAIVQRVGDRRACWTATKVQASCSNLIARSSKCRVSENGGQSNSHLGADSANVRDRKEVFTYVTLIPTRR